VVLTGVSGSGKSTLAFEVLAPSVQSVLEARLARDGEDASPTAAAVGPDDSVRGVFCEACRVQDDFVRVARAEGAIGPGSASSTPATVTGVFDHIRDRFAATPAARDAGLTKRHFSTHVKGGRCERCDGLGQTRVSLDFLPDVWAPCEDCRGARYMPAVLDCRWRGLSIADVLSTRVSDARVLFAEDRQIGAPLVVLDDLGLGYLALGQPTSTLSGGERQRLGLAVGLLRPASGRSLYFFDEPTTGLHPDDVLRLLAVFDMLLAAGHTLLVVEHNLDVIKSADWVIDLGPEGGPAGGQVVAVGTPEEVARNDRSHTGRALAGVLAAGRGSGSPGRRLH